MRRLRPTTILPACAALVLVAGAGAAQSRGAAKAPAARTPEAVVTALYRSHYAHHQRWDLTFKRERARFAPELLALLDEDARKQAATPDEVVGLDFDPLTAAQDESSGYRLGGTARDGADAIVTVLVRFGDETRTVRVRLAPSGATWRVANLLYEEGDLISDLKAPN